MNRPTPDDPTATFPRRPAPTVERSEHERANALFVGQNVVLTMLAGGAPLAETLAELARVCEADLGDAPCSILLLDTDGLHLHHGAAPSLPASYTQAIDGGAIGPDVGSCGAAAFHAAPVIVTDIQTDARWVNYRELAAAHGLRACWSTPILDADGAVLGTFAVYYRDVRRPTPAEEAAIALATKTAAIVIAHTRRIESLRRREASLNAAQERARMGSWEFDLQTGRGTWSPQLYRIFGFDPAKPPPPTEEFIDFVHPEDRAHFLDVLTNLNAAGSYALEYRSNPARGPVRYLASFVEVTADASGRGTLAAGSVLDVTEQRRLEGELRQAQKMEALGTLAGGIAHDFNNILTAIRGNTRLALADLDADHAARACLGQIDAATTRACDLVGGILTFSRRHDHHRTAQALEPVLEEPLKLLRATLPAMIQIDADFHSDVPTVAVDSNQLHQLLTNLGTNAAHAMRERGGRLRVGLDAAAVDADLARGIPGLRPGLYARLTVADSGCGMDRATLEHAFEPFFTTKSLGQGTGLGLAVVHGIVTGHEGAITVDSRPGEGTTFVVYLPAAEAGGAPAPPANQAAPHGRGERVLYVDDEEPLVELMTRMLVRLGYRVTGCADPVAALEQFRAQPLDFDVVVTDLAMPTLSGPNLARELLRVRPDLPIVMISGYLRPEDVQMAQRIGVRDLLLKPDTIDELGSALHRVLSGVAG